MSAFGGAAKDLADQLFEIADDLDKAHSVASGFKVLGKVGAVAGLGIGIAATVVTGGLAAPLVVAGGAAAVAGSVTAVTAEVIEMLVTKEKIEKAQSKLVTFRRHLRSGRIAFRGATTALEASDALRGFIQSSTSVVNLAKVLPVLNKIFLVLDVIDILMILIGDNKSEAAKHIRDLAEALKKVTD